MENRIIRRNEHKIFIIMFNDDKMVKNVLKNVSNYSKSVYQKKTSTIFNGFEKESDSLPAPTDEHRL